MGVQDLRDVPALLFGRLQTLVAVQWVNRQRFACLRASNQVIEISVGVGGPNLFDDHDDSQT
jgi:hypothetical protein